MSLTKIFCSVFIFSILIASNSFAQSLIVDCISTENNICITSTVKIDPAAIERVRYLIRQMLKGSPDTASKFVRSGYIIDVLGPKQRATDLPRYKHLKGVKTFDGRKYDDLRGFADQYSAVIGIEDLLCYNPEDVYDNIFVHEFAHSIHYYLAKEITDKIERAYLNARKKQLYPLNIYMMANSHEYWAMATEAWFNSTEEVINNVGINSREAILRRDPEISKTLRQVYGIVEIEDLEYCEAQPFNEGRARSSRTHAL